MKLIYNFFIALYATFFCASLQIVGKPSFEFPTTLAHLDKTDDSCWLLHCPQGFDLVADDKKKHTIASSHLFLRWRKGKLECSGLKIKSDHLRIQPKASCKVHGREFDGYFAVVRKNQQCTITHYHHKQLVLADLNAKIDTQQSALVALPEPKQEKSESTDDPQSKFNVRVLLDSKENSHLDPWILKSSEGFVIIDLQHPKKRYKIKSEQLKMGVTKSGDVHANGSFLFNGNAYVVPVNQITALHDKQYNGSMWLYKESNTVHIINCVNLEHYITSVLCTESWPGWPLEVNKVFAIASRTYAIAMIQDASAQKRVYHLKNTNAHQTYTGTHKRPELLEAVQQTKGLFLTYEGKPITAMFDVCCGGIVPAKMTGVDFKKAPYLARPYACTHCKVCKVYSWQAQYELSALEMHLKKGIDNIKRLKDLHITKKDKAGLVHQLGIKSHTGFQTITGKKAYSLLSKNIKSFCYTLRRHGNKIQFNGRGYGHHLGLCQWGAKEMVVKGSDYKEVLSFYYPNTQLMRLI